MQISEVRLEVKLQARVGLEIYENDYEAPIITQKSLRQDPITEMIIIP